MPTIEVETKVRIDDPSRVESQLQELSARLDEEKGRNILSINIFVDLEETLASRGQLLRIRQLCSEDNKVLATLLTSKGPRLGDDEIFKTKPEKNVSIELWDGATVEDLVELFQLVGFEVVERLEYVVTAIYHWRSCEAAFKRIPFLGSFLEVEGLEEEIKELFASLGLDIDEATSKRYEELWEEYCEAEGIPFDLARFTFDYVAELAARG